MRATTYKISLLVGLGSVLLFIAVGPTQALAISDPSQISGLQLWLDGSDTSSMTLSYVSTGITVTSTSTNTTILTASGAIPASVATSSLIRVGATDIYTVAALQGTTIIATSTVASYGSAQTLYVERVSQLNDKSGNGANAVQPTTASQFTYIAKGDNGLPGLFHAVGTYSGSGSWFGGTFANSFSTSTVFAVGNMNPNLNNNSNNSNYFELGTSTPYLKASQSAGIAVNDTYYGVVDVPRNGAYIHAVYPVSYLKQVPSFITLGITNNNRALSVDGYTLPVYDTAPLILPAYKTYVVGATWTFNFPTQQLQGNFDEMIVYNRTLTATEQKSVEQYLMAKWGEGPPTGAPTNLATVPGNGTVQISFTAPVNNGGTPPFDYDIQYKLRSDSSYTEFPHSQTGVDPASVTVSGLTDNLLYDFKIAAVNALGTSTAFATVSSTPIPTTPDAPISLVMLYAASGSLALSWLAPANTGGSPITSYRISYAPLGGATSTVTTTGTAYTLIGLTNNLLYYATVRATTASGDGPESAMTTGVTFNPNDPTSFGYQTSFDDEFNSASTIDSGNTGAAGYNWYFKQPFGFPTLTSGNVSVSGGELTLSGSMNQGGGLQSAYAPAGQSAPTYVGNVFSGGWYAEARIKFNASAINVANGEPAFWMYPMENYQNYASGHTFSLLTHTVEDDLLDDYNLNNPYPNCATMGLGDNGSFLHNTTCPSGVSFDNVYHIYSQLWVPSINGKLGYIQSFVDGIPTGYASWTYISATTTTPFSMIEQTHYPLILTIGTDSALTVDYVRIWQTPQFSALTTASASSSQATVSWNTRDYVSQKLVFGPSTSYGSSTPETGIGSTTNGTSHAFTLNALTSCATYHYSVVAGTPTGGYATSTDQTFSTSGCTGNAPIVSSNQNSITVGSGGTVTQGALTLIVPTSFTATSSSATFEANQLNATAFFASSSVPGGKTAANSNVFNLKALIDASTTLSSFAKPLSVTIAYSPSDITGIAENSLTIYRYDSGVWTALSNCSINTAAHTITCSTSNFSDFALFGDAQPVSSGSSSGGGGLIVGSGSNAPGYVNTNTYSTTITSTTTPSITTDSTSFTFTRDLAMGAKGEDVLQLQVFLNTHEFTVASIGPGSIGNETTHFGPATQAALAKYQASKGVTPTVGYFGPKTRATMSGGVVTPIIPAPTQTTIATSSSSGTFTRDLQLGDTGSDVMALQQYLNTHGYMLANFSVGSVGNETDYFGDATKYQLSKFQADNGIVPAQGYFGAKTRALVSGN